MSTLDDHQARIARVVEHLERDLDAPFDVPTLAGVASLSEFHFHRVFRAVIGESVMGHVRRLRLERAARFLRSTDEKVVSIALGAGFDAHEAFTRAFSAHFGVSPSDYRKAHLPAPGSSTAPSPPPDFARLEARPALTLWCVRHVGPYSGVGEAWSRLFRLCGARMKGAPIGLCHDDPEITDPARFRYDACAEVAPDVQPTGEVRVLVLEGGRFVIARHLGSYSLLGQTYGQLARWALERDLELTVGPSIERYFDSPGSIAEPELRTDVALRVQ